MGFHDALLNPAIPMTLFEVVPPALANAEAMEKSLAELRQVRSLVDAINIPEIHDEDRPGERTGKFIERVEPRVLGARIKRELGIDAVINRVTVHDAEPERWFRETLEQYEIPSWVLVGGESKDIHYPGPNPGAAAKLVKSLGLPVSLGAITIPSRVNEPERIRKKHADGVDFFTSQVMFDSNDLVWLIQRLNGVEARIFISFAPVSHQRDLDFLRWLGVDLPLDLDRFLLGSQSGTAAPAATCLERSINLAQRILMDIFDNLPPDPPLIGLNIEHINRRNFAPALAMLQRLGNLYTDLVAARMRVEDSGSRI
jgi:5,10-methylenetetrahydrofolate reductase